MKSNGKEEGKKEGRHVERAGVKKKIRVRKEKNKEG